MSAKHFLNKVFYLCIVLVIVSCNNSAQEKEKKQNDTGTAAPNPAPAAEKPAGEVKTKTEKCFTNPGLKYETVITLVTDGNELSGNVKSTELETTKAEQVNFTGTADGNKLTITFQGNAPVVGASSEWTTKPWVLENAEGKEKLLITFNAKNYETNKWQEMVYEFLPCGK